MIYTMLMLPERRPRPWVRLSYRNKAKAERKDVRISRRQSLMRGFRQAAHCHCAPLLG